MQGSNDKEIDQFTVGNKYEGGKILGEGSYGVVYQMNKIGDKSANFAVKKVQCSDQNEIDKSKRESELLIECQHSFIVKYYEVIKEKLNDFKGYLWIVMELCTINLKDYLEKNYKTKIVAEDLVLKWTCQLALALEYLHFKKIVHRDIKEENILMDSYDNCKVADFGLARYKSGDRTENLGTFFYQSPELIQDMNNFCDKSDMWSVGCVIHNMCTRAHPFSEYHSSVLNFVKAIEKKIQPPIIKLYSEKVQEIVNRLICYNLKSRLSAYELLQMEILKPILDRHRESISEEQWHRVCKNKTSLVYMPDRQEFLSSLNSSTNVYETMQNWKHVYQSYMSKRSTNSVTILLLGISGAGKSSTINSLFGTNISEVDERKSCTSELIEFSAHFPSTFLGMSNSQIHVIDTPGFNDPSGGVEFDGRVIANISDFFKSKDYFPNIVLLVLNINDNRINGEFSPFVKTLKIIQQQLVKTVIDNEHPNLVIVLTHLCYSANDRKNPSTKITRIKHLIAEHLGVTNCPVVVAENRPDEWDLKMIGPDYYQLPNGDLFPKNIFDAMKELTENEDGVGNYLIQDAYRNLPKLKTKFKKTSHQIVRKPMEDIIRDDMSWPKRSELYERINAGNGKLTMSFPWKYFPPFSRA